MYSVREYEDKFKMYELREESTNSSISLCPERGAIITSFAVGGKEILYLDKDTFYDLNANIRGGIPILFPISGQLREGKYELDGKTYFMRNHGFARINSWEVINTSEDNKASITLRLKDNEETRRAYPFEFELLFTYILKDGKLIIEQEYCNKSDETMPIYAGFHPYFNAEGKDIEYKTTATKYLDYNDMKIKEYKGRLDLTSMAESAIFLDAKEKEISFEVPNLNRSIVLKYGKEFKYVVVWSVKDKKFVCVEPWMAPNQAFNTLEDLCYIKPQECLKTFFAMKVNFNF